MCIRDRDCSRERLCDFWQSRRGKLHVFCSFRAACCRKSNEAVSWRDTSNCGPLSYGPPYAGKLNRSTNLAFLTVFQNLHQHDDIVSRCCDYFNCPLPLTTLIWGTGTVMKMKCWSFVTTSSATLLSFWRSLRFLNNSLSKYCTRAFLVRIFCLFDPHS